MKKGFTLAELLIALAILGVIATFTIPKVLQNQQNTKNKAIVRETAATIAEAYQNYKRSNTPTATTAPQILMPYFNYVKVDTSSVLDGSDGDTPTWTCNNTNQKCLLLHNGAKVLFADAETFGGTSNLNLFWLLVDPDGVQNTNVKSVWLALYFNGRVTSWSNLAPGSMSSWGVFPSCPSCDPDWFSWD